MQYIYGKDREPTEREQTALDSGAEALDEAVVEVAEAVAGGGKDMSLEEVWREARRAVSTDNNPMDKEQHLGVKCAMLCGAVLRGTARYCAMLCCADARASCAVRCCATWCCSVL